MNKRLSPCFLAFILIFCPAACHAAGTPDAQSARDRMLYAGYGIRPSHAQIAADEILRVECSSCPAGPGTIYMFTDIIWTIDVAEGVLFERAYNGNCDVEVYAYAYAIPPQKLTALVEVIRQSDFFSLPEDMGFIGYDGSWESLTVSTGEKEHRVHGGNIHGVTPFPAIMEALGEVYAAARENAPLSHAVPRDEPLKISLLSQFFSYAWGTEMRVVFLDQYGDVRAADLGALAAEGKINSVDDVLAYLSDSAHSEVIARVTPNMLEALESAVSALWEIEPLQGESKAHDCGRLFRYAIQYDNDGIAHALDLSMEGEVMARRDERESLALLAWLDLYQPSDAFFPSDLRYYYGYGWNFLECYGDVLFGW
ncbi:MAG: hypothetical protein FWF69_04550 [Firmicutes bacterium]|nr:hypothetical protein [Bacillota bacterium]